VVTVLEEQTVDYALTARIATEALAAENVRFSPERIKWLYERGFRHQQPAAGRCRALPCPRGSSDAAELCEDHGLAPPNCRFSNASTLPLSEMTVWAIATSALKVLFVSVSEGSMELPG
jgi:hypothetical protein